MADASFYIVRPRSRRECLTLAFELGNLHVPVEITPDAFRVPADGPVDELLERMGLSPAPADRSDEAVPDRL